MPAEEGAPGVLGARAAAAVDEAPWRGAWIALGSNLGARCATLEAALRRLDASPDVAVRRVSSWYATEPVGGPPGQRRYRNGVAEIETRLAGRDLLALLLAVEAEFGRDRSREERNGPRTLDLDLLMLGDEHVEAPGLVLPHPRMEERTFVLEPLCELAPELELPASGRRVCDRLRELQGAG